MTLTKQDYMRLPKERLAELLVEKDREHEVITNSLHQPKFDREIPCWADGGWCPNPFQDCIGCPRPSGAGTTFTSTENTFQNQEEKTP